MKSSDIIALLEEGKKVTKKSWEGDSYVMLVDITHFVYSWEKKYIRIHKQTCSENYVMQSILSEPDEWEEYNSYPRDLDFLDAYRLAKEEGAIIKSDKTMEFYCDGNDNALKSSGGFSTFNPNETILDKWDVVGYKGKWNEV